MKSIFSLLIPASLLLAGCTAEETPGNGPAIPPVEATVPLGIESASLNAEVTSRAATTLTSGSIGIFLSGTGYTAINNRRYDYATSVWGPNGGAANTVYLGATPATVCAYHPWQAGINNSTAVALASGVYAAGNDLSFALNRSMDGTPAGSKTAFNMKRAYARLTFTFTRPDYPGTCQVQQVQLKNLLLSAKLNIGTGGYSTSVGTLNSSILQKKDVIVSATGSTGWGDDFLVVPCTPAGSGMTIVITVNGKSMTTNIPTADYAPKAGEHKTVTISLRGTGIHATSVTTEDWANSNLGPYEPKP